MNELLAGLQQLIELGKALNEIKPSVDSKKSAQIIFAQIEGGIMMAKVSDDVSLLNSALDYLKAYINTQLKL